MNEMEPENSKNIKNQMIPEESKSVKNSRLTDFEMMINDLTDKLESYEKIIEDLQCKADLHLTNASQNNEYLSSKIDSVNVNLQERLYKLEARFDDLSPIIMNLGLNDEKQRFLIENLTNNLLSSNSQLDSISHILNSVCHQDQFTELKANFESLRAECKQSQIASNLYAQDLYDNHQKVHAGNKKLLEDLKKEADIRYAEEIKIKHDLQGLEEETKSLKFIQNTMFHDLKNVFSPMIDEKINAIPQPAIPSLDDAKVAMQKQLEPVVLDAKNANLRSTNTDVKVHVLEKKLEQLKLMVDQINLQG